MTPQPTTEKEYLKLSKEKQDEHHAKIREELIERGLIKPKPLLSTEAQQ